MTTCATLNSVKLSFLKATSDIAKQKCFTYLTSLVEICDFILCAILAVLLSKR